MIDYTVPLEDLPDPLPIEPLTVPFDVTITPPGSKSITNRAYILAALAKGESKIIRPLRSDDCDMLLDALCTLGATARWDSNGEDVFITGVNGRFPSGGTVNLGHGGTPARFMIAAACLADEPVIVDGSKRMRERPVAEGVDMLRQLGARIEYVEEEGRLPVRIVPDLNLKGGRVVFAKTQSSQFLSALLLIAPSLRDGLGWSIADASELTSASYLWLTVQMMDEWGIRADATGDKLAGYWSSLELQERHARNYPVEPDASGAVYWAQAVAIAAESNATLLHTDDNSIQPDARAWAALASSGLIQQSSTPSITIRHLAIQNALRPNSLSCDCSEFPDGSLALACVCATLKSSSTLTGLHTLRVKETDRIAALQTELTKCGCAVEATDDSLTITPLKRDPSGYIARTKPVTIETYDDHRMAMAFAILGLVRPGMSIANPSVVSKSYPTFWRDFAKLYHNQRTS